MTAQAYYAFAAGMFFMSMILAIGCFIAFRQDARPIPAQAMWIFRVILALSGAAFAGFLTGFLDIGAKSGGWMIKSGGDWRSSYFCTC